MFRFILSAFTCIIVLNTAVVATDAKDEGHNSTKNAKIPQLPARMLPEAFKCKELQPVINDFDDLAQILYNAHVLQHHLLTKLATGLRIYTDPSKIPEPLRTQLPPELQKNMDKDALSEFMKWLDKQPAKQIRCLRQMIDLVTTIHEFGAKPDGHVQWYHSQKESIDTNLNERFKHLMSFPDRDTYEPLTFPDTYQREDWLAKLYIRQCNQFSDLLFYSLKGALLTLSAEEQEAEIKGFGATSQLMPVFLTQDVPPRR